MDINDLIDGIVKSINLFADLSACGHAQAGEIAEQRLRERICLRQGFGRQVQESGRGPENGGENAENFEAEKKAAV